MNSKFETTSPKDVLLDSSLKSNTKSLARLENPRQFYNCKFIDCGDYFQVYYLEDGNTIKNNKGNDLKKSIIKSIDEIDTDNIYTKNNINSPKTILLSNAIRSNLNCQRIAKSNSKEWESFITLTFKDNITDISTANKIFNQWALSIRRVKKDFKYIAVPEFQKRGAVHYHILSNLGKNDTNIIHEQRVKSGKAVNYDTLYDIKFWTKGYARIDFVKFDYKKIFSYICKYMTKDIDNRLFGKKRYFFSQNLNKPCVSYLNLNNSKDFDFITQLNDCNIEYESEYLDIYTKQKIHYFEYKKIKD